MKKVRLDQLLVDRKLVESLAEARAVLMAEEVTADGKKLTKPGTLVKEGVHLEQHSKRSQFVSRGGIKLAGALDYFEIDVTDLNCLDVGVSTGGFTDCLLQRGARHVFAIDVGKGHLDTKLRNDSRVTWRESFHIRKLTPDLLPDLIDLAVVDVSFISLKKVLPLVTNLIRSGGKLLALIKPQFEASRKEIQGTGVVKDERRRQEIIQDIVDFASKELSLREVGIVDASIPGAKGNREAFLFALNHAPNISHAENQPTR